MSAGAGAASLSYFTAEQLSLDDEAFCRGLLVEAQLGSAAAAEVDAGAVSCLRAIAGEQLAALAGAASRIAAHARAPAVGPDAVRAALALAGPGALLVVTGHSLGAAIAEVATLDLLAAELPPHAGLTHYSFGTPRVGNAAWAAAVSAAAAASRPDSYYRVVHALDPVPRLPPHEVLDYVHPPREVWYSENSSSFVVCSAVSGEDPACSDSDVPVGAADHTHYLNVTLGSEAC